MKHTHLLIVVGILILVSGCTSPNSVTNTNSASNNAPLEIPAENTESTPTTPSPIPEVPIVAESTPEIVVEPTPEETPVEETVSFTQPTLTYDNAYNGTLIDTSSQVSGSDVDIDLYMENNNRNGVHAFIGFFGFTGDYPADLLNDYAGPGYMIDSLQRYPGRIIPFFTLGLGGDETRAYLGEPLKKYYLQSHTGAANVLGQNIIQGIGEVEQYAFRVKPNSAKLKPLFDWAVEQNMHIMFHPLAGQLVEVEDLLKKYPSTKFIMHMFPEDFSKDRTKLIELMKKYPTLFYSVDADHMMYDGQIGLLYKYQTISYLKGAERFVKDYDSTHTSLLNTALGRYRPLIEAVPDQVMWGTELGTRYGHEPAAYDRVIRFAREFIGKLKPENQEKFAYLNAWKTFGPAPIVTTAAPVQETADWPECTSSQENKCFNSCIDQFPDYSASWEDDGPPDFEACWDMCAVSKQCIVPLVID